jgi:histidyl-tRNA synthetase
VVIVGEGELQSGQWTVRTLADGSQQTVARAGLVDWLVRNSDR